jgi:hypothetical protein
MGHNRTLIAASTSQRIQMTTTDARRPARLRRAARFAVAGFVACLLLATTACAKPVAPLSDDEAIVIATRFLDLFDAGKVEEAREAFSVDLRNTLSVEDLQETHAAYARRAPESSRGEPSVERIGDAAVVEVPVQRGQLVMQASITVGPDRRIEGLFYSLDEGPQAKPAPAADGADAPDADPDADPDTAPDADAGIAA